MKKVLKVVALVVVLMLGLQMCVHADMGAPMIKPYKAKVINPNGVECRDYQDNIVATLKYGDEIEIAYETSWSDEKYATFETEEHKNARINFKDIAPVEEMYVSKELKVDNPINRVVVAMEGAVLYKGPSLAYDKLGVVIPRGTEIVTYGEGLGDNPWFYTTYEGVSGWVCELGILGEYTDDTEIILSETEFTGLSKGEEIPEDLGTIPTNTLIKNPILLDPWEQSYYIKYNGKWGRVGTRTGVWSTEKIKIYTTDKDLKIRENPFDTYEDQDEEDLPKVIGIIPANTEIAIKYEHEYTGSSYISYNGIRGWVDVPYTEDAKYVETTDLELPNFDDFNVIEGEKIPVAEVEENEEIVENENPVIGDLVVSEDVVKGDTSNKEDVITIEVTPEQIVAFGVVGAVVIALTCIVTIILINKTSKKKVKKEEVKVENKE